MYNYVRCGQYTHRMGSGRTLLAACNAQKKQVFKNKRKNASYVSIMFLKPTFLCF